MPYGINFQPGTSPSGGTDPQSAGRGGSPLQSAIQMLSLRLPSVVGARSVAPQALLQAPGGAGGGLDLVALLRRLMQQSGAQAPPGALPSEGLGGGHLPDVGPVGGMSVMNESGQMMDGIEARPGPLKPRGTTAPQPRVVVGEGDPNVSVPSLPSEVTPQPGPSGPMGTGQSVLERILAAAGSGYQK